jgi:hypothetical protein
MAYARLCAFWLFLISFSVAAAPKAPVVPTAVVDALVMPAWLERGGRSEALTPGAEVREGDHIRTGAGARVYVRLIEGSTVKLGENAKFGFAAQEEIDKTLFTAAYEVLAGAFRYTTAKLKRDDYVRDVKIKLATSTIGIRGTDVWGKNEPDKVLVILIEGNILVSHDSGETTPMAGERATFVAPRGAKPLPLSRSSEEDLAKRARETEIEAGDGAVRVVTKVKGKGKTKEGKVRLGTGLNQEQALYLRDVANHHGYAVTIKPRRGDAGDWTFDVLLSGFADGGEARVAKEHLPEKLRAAAVVL